MSGIDAGRSDSFSLVSLAAVTWDFKLVGRTRMLTEAWQQMEQATVFVQVPSLRTAVERVLAPFRGRAMVPVVRPWPTVPARMWAGTPEARLRAGIRRRARGLRRQLDRHLDWKRAVALVVSPVWTPWLEELPFRCVVYDCIDELAVQVPRAELMELYRRWEDELLERADGAVVTAEVLGEDLRRRRADLRVTLIRNGVDVEWFQRLALETARPEDVAASTRPIVGFVGALYDWIDWELIRRAAESLPEFDFVFVGPHDQRGDVKRLEGLANVRLLGPRAYERVPAYMQAFDVCWVPFVQTEVGRAANPVKIYEYLALGKPVVTTPVADTDSFRELVTVTGSAADMVAALREAVARRNGQTDERVRFARENDWRQRAAAYVDFVRTVLRAG